MREIELQADHRHCAKFETFFIDMDAGEISDDIPKFNKKLLQFSANSNILQLFTTLPLLQFSLVIYSFWRKFPSSTFDHVLFVDNFLFAVVDFEDGTPAFY